jgi:hypothetical protein
MLCSVVLTNWQAGSDVTFTRIYNGIQYQDKGQILEVTEKEFLKSTYWSSRKGYDNTPQNYFVITYSLEMGNPVCYTLKYRREKIPLVLEQKNRKGF